MGFQLSDRDNKRLEGVDPKLVKVVLKAAALSPVVFMVVEGVRSDEQCRINYGKGRSIQQCLMAGIPGSYAAPRLNKVTWLKNPYNSRHRKQADGFGKAVDLLPAPYDWKDTKPFDQVNAAMQQAASELGVDIRWGADWDEDGVAREKGETDSPHWELG
jgi:peptidoglycan LD-endopeptidase CwlK